MDGILLVDKPRGWTSFDVVAKVRGVLRTANRNQQLENGAGAQTQIPNSNLLVPGSPKVKVGHTGTLDPLATGLLVLLIGKATKQAPELSKLDKVYEATIKLGFNSSTGDEEGEKQFVSDQRPSKVQIQEALDKFVGEIEQVPPAYSAIKVRGQRAYRLARQGKSVELKSRKVTIYEITDISIHPGISLNTTIVDFSEILLEVKFKVRVSSGTYIRTLAEDIGKELGTGAYLTNLKRTQVGDFKLQDALTVENISPETIYQNLVL